MAVVIGYHVIFWAQPPCKLWEASGRLFLTLSTYSYTKADTKTLGGSSMDMQATVEGQIQCGSDPLVEVVLDFG